ncbi:MAG TPA: hypothetical protein VK524_27975 [Polyangiaceae bacterium]|nr:hypothetical protein [Polyangiaceae bacterium]
MSAVSTHWAANSGTRSSDITDGDGLRTRESTTNPKTQIAQEAARSANNGPSTSGWRWPTIRSSKKNGGHISAPTALARRRRRTMSSSSAWAIDWR